MSAAALESAPVGRAEDDRTRLSRAILQLLEGLSVRQGGYFESLDHYQGELGDGDGLEQVMAKLRGRSPAALVTIGGVRYQSKSTTRRKYLGTYQVEIAVVSQHLTSMEARGVGGADRFEPQADPGAYSILSDIRDKLAARKPNVAGATHLIPESEDVVYQGDDLVIYAARYTVAMGYRQTTPGEGCSPKAETVSTNANLQNEAPQ